MGQVINRDQLGQVAEHLHSLGPHKIVWTSGCFDLLHAGHVRSLRAAWNLGDYLVVGVNSDESVARLKGRDRPIIPAAERAEMIAAITGVHYVVVFHEDTPTACIEELRPHVVCKGEEYRTQPMPETAIVEGYGGRVEFLSRISPVSTTEIVRRIIRAFLGSTHTI
jgi:rfaE bifunctional protein nucleotidyltransferase chain/domain